MCIVQTTHDHIGLSKFIWGDVNINEKYFSAIQFTFTL